MAKPLQQVNLYQPLFRKRKIPFAAATIGKILGLLVLVYVLIYGAFQWRVGGLDEQLEQARARRDALQENVAKLREQLPHREPSVALQQKLLQLQAQRKASRDILAKLNKEMQQDAIPFSSYFTGLARQDMSGLWLSSIRIGAAGEELALGGGVSRPELVPKFLAKLSAEPAFQGRTFQVLQLNRREQEPFIEFSLLTTAGEEQ
jgi:molybdopterin converting factor small subunit